MFPCFSCEIIFRSATEFSSTCVVFAVKASLSTEQMKVLDTFGQNMIIEAYSRCFEVDEAIKFFREMGLYGCQPNAYTCGYIATRL